jgi:hypothetical protein
MARQMKLIMNPTIYPFTGVVPAVCDAEAGQQSGSKYELDQVVLSADSAVPSSDAPCAKTQHYQSFPASHSATFRT